jgi:hypothetical protein
MTHLSCSITAAIGDELRGEAPANVVFSNEILPLTQCHGDHRTRLFNGQRRGSNTAGR